MDVYKKNGIIIFLILLTLLGFQLLFTPSMLYAAVSSPFAKISPKIDGVVSSGEWNNAVTIDLNHGSLLCQNDATNLYLLIDLPGDNEANNSDYFSLSFDVDVNGAITPLMDVRFGMFPGTFDLGIGYYSGPAATTGINESDSFIGAGFGPSDNSSDLHRIWEVAIDLYEINASQGDLVRLGLNTYSQSPNFNDNHPAGFHYDFSNLIEIVLHGKDIELLIVTHEDFYNALKPLQEHKDYTDMNTYIISWQNLNHTFGMEGIDEAERVKLGLALYKQVCGIKYAMLVGDCDRFPVRYTMTDRGDANAYNRAFYSGDIYYADLYKSDGTFDNWDADNDGYYGELIGETLTGFLNADLVDLEPDIAVGRIPASTIAEVTTYVNKVISYEFNAYKSGWFKKALLVAGTGWDEDACETKEYIAYNYLTEFSFTKLYGNGNPCLTTPLPNAVNINNALNQGVGFGNYIGHGNRTGWDAHYNINDIATLTNNDKLPIIFASACGTAQYTTQPPYDAYTDINGIAHTGTDNGEIFNNIPTQPACIQTNPNPDSLAEEFLVKNNTGAIGYIGCVTGGQGWGKDLDECFFKAYDENYSILGQMCNFMFKEYYDTVSLPAFITSPDWYEVAGFHQPWKFHLFGDPSLRVGGISQIQKKSFLGSYIMYHDGCKGQLILWAGPDILIGETLIPNIQGTYRDSNNQEHDVYGYVRTWRYTLPEDWGPDHQIIFYIDFSDTLTKDDDIKFEGYLFTQTKNAMAGRYLDRAHYGFYAIKPEIAYIPSAIFTPILNDSKPDTDKRIESKYNNFDLESEVYRKKENILEDYYVYLVHEVVNRIDFEGIYDMVYDGWEGTLELLAEPHPFFNSENIRGIYRRPNGMEHDVHGYAQTGPGNPGNLFTLIPNHIINFYIDFNDTPEQGDDDQSFRGYLFTHTKDAMAGYTYWNDIPFGFYARKKDLEPPQLICPENIIKNVALSNIKVTVDYSATVADNLDPNPEVIYEPPSGTNFCVGEHTILVSATDAHGNNSECTFKVIVKTDTIRSVTYSNNFISGFTKIGSSTPSYSRTGEFTTNIPSIGLFTGLSRTGDSTRSILNTGGFPSTKSSIGGFSSFSSIGDSTSTIPNIGKTTFSNSITGAFTSLLKAGDFTTSIPSIGIFILDTSNTNNFIQTMPDFNVGFSSSLFGIPDGSRALLPSNSYFPW